MIRQIPNLFTLCNLFCGCMAIVFTLHPVQVFTGQDQDLIQRLLTSRWMLAPFWIFAAAIIDFLDGFIARWMKAESSLGGQLDSLSDVVSFGVAPGMIIYQLLQHAYRQGADAMNVSQWVLLPAFLLPLAAAWRLAVFNLDTEQRHSFRGVPTPLTALVVASLPLILWFDEGAISQWLQLKWVLYSLLLVLSVLMVSRLKLMSLKVKSWAVQAALPQYLLLVGSVFLLIFLQWTAIPLIYLLFLALSLIFHKQIA